MHQTAESRKQLSSEGILAYGFFLYLPLVRFGDFVDRSLDRGKPTIHEITRTKAENPRKKPPKRS